MATATKTEDLKIVGIIQENIKGIKLAEITPDGECILIGGTNASGKSSLLDGMMIALQGVGTKQPSPLRNGEKRGRSFLDLGKYTVERIFTESSPGGRVVVKSKDGATYPSPQKLLDDLYGDIAFDPLEFSRLRPDDQAEQLRKMVGIDFTDLEAKHKEAYDERTAVNRDLKNVKGKLDGGGFLEAPTEEVSAFELAAELESRTAQNAANDEKRRELEALDNNAKLGQSKLAEANQAVREAEEALERARQKVNEIKGKLARVAEQRLLLVAEVEHIQDADVAEVTEQIRQSEEMNSRVRANRERQALLDRESQLLSESESLTTAIDKIKEERSGRLQKAKFPIEGLSFNEEGRVTFDGVLLSQCSTAEKIRVSTAIAVALAKDKPLKLLLIRDGTLMLPPTLRMVAGMAAEAGFTTYIEWATETGEGCQVVIEDGMARQKQVAAEEAIY